MASSGAVAQSDSDICAQLPEKLVPLQITHEVYTQPHTDDRTGEFYTDHRLVYTRFEIRSAVPVTDDFSRPIAMAFVSGTLGKRAQNGAREEEKIDLAFFEASAFASRMWVYSRFSDVETWGLHGDVRLAGSVRAYMQAGAVREAEYCNTDRFSSLYDCQHPQGPPPGGYPRQQMDTMRVALVDNRTYMVTTKPIVLVAEARLPDKTARYFQCSAGIGQRIDADTDRVRAEALKTDATRVER